MHLVQIHIYVSIHTLKYDTYTGEKIQLQLRNNQNSNHFSRVKSFDYLLIRKGQRNNLHGHIFYAEYKK